MTTTTVYKIVRPDLTTQYGERERYVVGEWMTAPGTGALCSAGWHHCYRHPLLAVLHNPIHGDYAPLHLYEAEARGVALHEGWMKSGYSELRLVGLIPTPPVTTDQRVRYAIACAWGRATPRWRDWANSWLARRAHISARATEWASEEESAARWAEGAARATARTAVAASEEAARWAEAMAARWAAVAAVAATREARAEEVPLSRYAEWSMTESLEVPQ